jgi:hypothetical protein
VGKALVQHNLVLVDKQQPAGNCPLALLEDLRVLLAAERRAIKAIDQSELQLTGDTIQQLIEKLSVFFPLSEEYDSLYTNQVISLLKEVRCSREENGLLFQELFNHTGAGIEQINLGRKALKAYFALEKPAEIFLKKNC